MRRNLCGVWVRVKRRHVAATKTACAIAIAALAGCLLAGCGLLAGAFYASPSHGEAPLAVRFTPRNTARVTSWHWDFGDESGSNSESPLHTYTSPGAYDVSLLVEYTTAFGMQTSYAHTQPGCVSVQGESSGGWVYMTDVVNSELLRMRLDGTSYESLGSAGDMLANPFALDIDSTNGWVFILDAESKVARTGVDGQDPSLFVDRYMFGLDIGSELVVDSEHGLVYVASEYGVSRARTDGSGGWSILRWAEGSGVPGGVATMAVDARSDKMYWASDYSESHIWRSNLDGSGTEDLGDLDGRLRRAGAIAIDGVNRRLYVNNLTGGPPTSVLSASLEGTDVKDLGDLGQSPAMLCAMAVDSADGSLYVVFQHQRPYLVKADLEGNVLANYGYLGGPLESTTDIFRAITDIVVLR